MKKDGKEKLVSSLLRATVGGQQTLQSTTGNTGWEWHWYQVGIINIV